MILVLLILIGLGGLIVVQNVWLTPKLTGNSITKTFTPQLLSELFIDGVFTINLLQDNTNEIKITTDEALFDCLTIKEHLHQFSLMHKSNCTSFGRNTPQITVDITFQQLKKLDFGGVSDVYSLNHAILEESLLLKVSGVSKANLHLTAPEIKADIS
ncbi:MAG: DUF2807 domain-containing protein [Candidatus Peribacteria bacterium]|nr:DUF2807 domain-containing protein [Candidatus Peribacteria bacterium]